MADNFSFGILDRSVGLPKFLMRNLLIILLRAPYVMSLLSCCFQNPLFSFGFWQFVSYLSVSLNLCSRNFVVLLGVFIHVFNQILGDFGYYLFQYFISPFPFSCLSGNLTMCTLVWLMVSQCPTGFLDSAQLSSIFLSLWPLESTVYIGFFSSSLVLPSAGSNLPLNSAFQVFYHSFLEFFPLSVCSLFINISLLLIHRYLDFLLACV